MLTFVNHTECHCIDRSNYYAEGIISSNGAVVQRATMLNCNCPVHFERILQNDGQCRCDCSSSNYDCDYRKRGSEHFSLEDRKWVESEGTKVSLLIYNSLSYISLFLPLLCIGASRRDAASRPPANMGRIWRRLDVVPIIMSRPRIRWTTTMQWTCRKCIARNWNRNRNTSISIKIVIRKGVKRHSEWIEFLEFNSNQDLSSKSNAETCRKKHGREFSCISYTEHEHISADWN